MAKEKAGVVYPTREPTEAEEQRTLAQADESRAAAEESRAAASHWAALTRMADAQADAEELALVKAVNDAARESEKREAELAADEQHYTYMFSDEVSANSVSRCMTKLNLWRRRHEADEEKPVITIIFKSPGGSVIHGMALYDHISTMKREGWEFITVARGYAASMGGILLQAGTKRYVGDQAYVLIHEIQSFTGGTMGEIEDEVEFLKMIQERILKLFADRSGGKISVASLRRKWRRKNWWLNATECIKYGIADEIG